MSRPPIGAQKMRRMCCPQQWFRLADGPLEGALYDNQPLRDFAGIDLPRDSAPDATTLLKFCRPRQCNDITRALLDEINARLGERGLLTRAETIVDTTIIAAPASTKNGCKTRDPRMHPTVAEELSPHKEARCKRLAKNQAQPFRLFGLHRSRSAYRINRSPLMKWC